ncbi:DUF2934 domain-containing protein [Methylomicrobium lacus]|uniref:DUF2934 domain-containing protein n=1 Tax=Methylomicrobium lacus TaxID=136992 RepID=UPI00045E7756|nr:DUF2934 domain-containing protein [Methylomicrobium lacus]
MNTSPENRRSPSPGEQNAEISPKTTPSAQACGERWAQESQKRHEWIAVAAYFKAEKRGFAPNHDWDDWFEAELDYVKRQVEDYLIILEEDGETTLIGLQRLAYSIGVEHPENIHSKTDLIQAIQCACQLLPCFRIGVEDLCSQFNDCQWRSECKKMIAVWKRYG